MTNDESRMLTCTECGLEAPVSDQAPGASCPINECGGVMHLPENEDEEDLFDSADIVVSDEDGEDYDEPVPVSEIDLEPSELVDDSDVILDDLGSGRSESFEVDVGETAMPGLAEGLSTEAIDRVTKLTAKADNRRQRAALKRPPTAAAQPFDQSPKSPPPLDYEEYDMEIDEEAAQKILVRVYDELETARSRWPDSDVLILGVPQYKILEPWAQGRHNASLEDVLAEFETIHVVPGPQIHVAVPNHDLLFKHLDDEE